MTYSMEWLGHTGLLTQLPHTWLFRSILISYFDNIELTIIDLGFYYLRQGGYVFASVSLFVCVCVCVINITQKVTDQFLRKF